jgi:hypothetical protein
VTTEAPSSAAPSRQCLHELREVRDLPDDDPRRQAALEEKRRLLALVDQVEGERRQR